MTEFKKDGELETPIEANDSLDNKNAEIEKGDTLLKNENDSEEKVELSKSELEKLQNKARDFDAIIEKKKKKEFIGDLSGEQPKIDVDEIVEKTRQSVLAEIENREREKNSVAYKENLAKAADKIIDTYKFLNAEDLKVLSQEFNPGESVREEELFSKLDAIIKVKFASKYEAQLKNKMQKEILADEMASNLGGLGSSTSTPAEEHKSLTEEDKMKDRYNNSLPKRFQFNKK